MTRKRPSAAPCRAGRLILCGALLGALLGAGCRPAPRPAGQVEPRRPARNVIVMIGDGLALPQIAFLTQYRRHVHPTQPETAFERLLRGRDHGLADIHTINPDGRPSLTVDSAASATQIACGVMSLPEVLGHDRDGRPCRTILEHARSLGMATGLVTDARITDATPAAFAAKQGTRKAEDDVAAGYVAGAAGRVDVLLGGGARHFLPQGTRPSEVPGCAMPGTPGTGGARADGRDLLVEARAAGYQLACTEAQLLAVPEADGAKVLGLFAGAEYPPHPERAAVPDLPSLETAARKAIRILERDPDGFFLLIEAGMIDLAAHAHDAGGLLRAMQEADRVLGALLAYVEAHPDTLLVVIGDHDTGSPVFTYRIRAPVTTRLPSGLVHTSSVDYGDAAATYGLLERQTLSLGGMLAPIARRLPPDGAGPDPAYPVDEAANDLIAAVEAHSAFTLTPEEARSVLVPAPALPGIPASRPATTHRLALVLAAQTRLRWATGGHTNLPVIVMAAGPEALASRVRGYYHTTDVGRLLFEALGR
ncbi:MAG TPA: alkaline phosphatase [Kofleriaceae bacterium]|nr:alkaline phosphatase [Kofleriaceae bacterium]